ncbi:MAG: hypothetical protein KAY24_01940 [Candidatus Eisenbacteria sp.]|nr:hypothetical protein [Candidatus Eisenbacteria bacterium]
MARLCLPVLVALALVGTSRTGATQGGVPTYPKVIAHTRSINQFSDGLKDTLSWFDMVNGLLVSPEVLAEMRARNPHQRVLCREMPQNISGWEESNPNQWVADTSWSIIRLCQFYAIQNDWYLYDTSGERIPEWNGWAANWTRYCPEGTYGTSVGMTYAEWYINVAMPQIAYHSVGAGGWPEPWGWESTAINGVAWEVFNDCPSVSQPFKYADADPDLDGEPEGITHLCWEGGIMDSLSLLMKETNEYIRQRLRGALPELVIVGVRAGTAIKPAWVWEEFNGLKLERWEAFLHTPTHPDHKNSWWSWMYGRRTGPQGTGGMLLGDGYFFAEQVMHPFAVDSLDGWDVTYIHLYVGCGWNPTPEEEQRVMRWGLGTSMLGEGYFTLVYDGWTPVWFPEYNFDFGEDRGDFCKELVGQDTLYVRLFENGFVEINPYFEDLAGVPSQDTRFSFWLTLKDLEAAVMGPDSVLLTWVVPEGEINTVDQTLIRYALVPMTPENWVTCYEPQDLIPVGEPGESLAFAVGELEPATTYYFAAKNVVHGRLEPGISNVVSVTTEQLLLPDSIPPAAIADLVAVASYEDGFDLEWTAPGDDGGDGTAQAYELGYLVGRGIADTTDWNDATRITEGLPAPAAAGMLQAYRLEGLDPETLYGLSLRAYDEEGNASPLVLPPLLATTLALLDSIPPEAPGDSTAPAPTEDHEAPAPPPAPVVEILDEEAMISLAWQASPECDLLGYNIYARPASASQREKLNDDPIVEPAWVFPFPEGTEGVFVSVSAVDNMGNESAPGGETAIFPERFKLMGPFPHPITTDASFSLVLPPDPTGSVLVVARIYSVSGHLVRHWVDESFPAGMTVTLYWDTCNDHGARVAPGLYFLKVQALAETEIRKIYIRRD